MNRPGGTERCPHSPPCPCASAPDREAAHTIVSHPEQGWSLLCNGIVIFEDTGVLLPDGASIAPHRRTSPSTTPVTIRRRSGDVPAAYPWPSSGTGSALGSWPDLSIVSWSMTCLPRQDGQNSGPG
jgi:Family of unknown function (DUF5999)